MKALAALIMLLWMVVYFSILGGVIYVVYHFVSKLW